jgi:hypothetical protein
MMIRLSLFGSVVPNHPYADDERRRRTEPDVVAVEAAFVARQALVEAAPIPKLLGDVVELRLRHESVSRDEVQALWLGAGLATHVGLAIFEEPERFVAL